MTDVALVGLGPWGLSAMERFIAAARQAPLATLTLHIVEPGRPGGGVFSADQPDYMILNTPCGQHSMYPFPEAPGERRLGVGFFEWATRRGYRWRGTDCVTQGPGQPVGPHDFLPRRLMGEYLEWAYEVLVEEAPSNVRLVRYRTVATDIEPRPDGEIVHLRNGETVFVDHVLITAGHMQEAEGGTATAPAGTASPYPVERYLSDVRPGQKVAIEGMGLVALDIVTAMTIGLGGRYADEGDGRLRYHASGREPQMYMFSRGGYPYCAKSHGANDPVGAYEPAICTPEAVRALKEGSGGARGIDARDELLPLVFAEMELCYYMTAAQDSAGAVRQMLVSAFEMGCFEEVRAGLAKRYGRFCASEHFFAGDGARFPDAQSYGRAVYDYLARDVASALVTGGASPLKAALETLRALRDTLRLAVEFKGLTYSSHVDFQAHLRGRFARLVAGPPVFRNQQLLALMDAGLLELPFGPAPEVARRHDGRTVVRSTALDQRQEVEVDLLVRAHLELPSVGRSSSPLLANLVERGRVRPLDFDGVPAGSIDMTEDFHPVGAAGCQERLWVFGVVTEGARYFTLYVPSPKSRSRAFVDAGICARAVLGLQEPAVVDLRAGDGAGAARDGGTSRPPQGGLPPGPQPQGPQVQRPEPPALQPHTPQVHGPESRWPEPRKRGGTGRGPVEHGDAGRARSRRAPAGPDSDVAGRVLSEEAPPGRRRPLRVALVNNMADAAFGETERQWEALLGLGPRARALGVAAGAPAPVVMERYTLPGIARSAEVRSLIARDYRHLGELWASPPDAMVVTGAEPRTPELTEEAYWPALEELLWWGRSAVPHVVASCLSAHAALWLFAGLPRRLLADKCSGVFEQSVDTSHPLMAGVGPLALPHSRFNGIPVAELADAGYDIAAGSGAAGWTVATGYAGQCRLLLLQGHPEYTRLTLLREYRRDVRRYMAGERGSYPKIPTGYLAPSGRAILEQLETTLTATGRAADRHGAAAAVAGGGTFPFDEVAATVEPDWARPSATMLANWLRDVAGGDEAFRGPAMAAGDLAPSPPRLPD